MVCCVISFETDLHKDGVDKQNVDWTADIYENIQTNSRNLVKAKYNEEKLRENLVQK